MTVITARSALGVTIAEWVGIPLGKSMCARVVAGEWVLRGLCPLARATANCAHTAAENAGYGSRKEVPRVISARTRSSCRFDEQAGCGRTWVSEITAKVHRGNVMRKMGGRSLADLVWMADTLGICQAKH